MKYIYIFSAISLLLTRPAYANQDIQIDGTIERTVSVQSGTSMKGSNLPSQPKKITLLKLKLSEKASEQIRQRIRSIGHNKPVHHFGTSGAESVQLGMNNVPVLDQGQHGTCVTFANTAAYDAIINKGDYISQLCILQLGKHLENNSYGLKSNSGWDGLWGPTVLERMENFGIVSKAEQQAGHCAGIVDYPHNSDKSVTNTELSLSDYHRISESKDNLQSNYMIFWKPILSIYETLAEQWLDIDIGRNELLQQIQDALDQGSRLTFGVSLYDTKSGIVGATGTYQSNNDTWVLSPEIINDILNKTEDRGGHEMIITGYDNNAIAHDAQGRTYKGLLTLRNSWGSDIADHGNFYMTYDYFTKLALEVQEIHNPIGKNDDQTDYEHVMH